MDFKYSFLTDELALQEIRKHKWIESQKSGKEVGFATAALDWIKKYGEEWKRFRLNITKTHEIFAEKRKHRRFNIKLPLTISVDNQEINCYTKDINLIGLSCKVPESISEKATPKVTVYFLKPTSLQNEPSCFSFEARMKHTTKTQNIQNTNGLDVFIPFPEKVRDYLRTNPTFCNS